MEASIGLPRFSISFRLRLLLEIDEDRQGSWSMREFLHLQSMTRGSAARVP